MRLAEIFRTTTFRAAAVASAAFAVAMILLFAFIYWQTAGYERARIELFVQHEAAAIAREPPEDLARNVDRLFAGDLHRQTFAAVFTAELRPIAGDLAAYPPGLPPDGRPHAILARRPSAVGTAQERVLAVALPLRDGRILVVGRSEEDLSQLRHLVWRALELGLIPGLVLALGAGSFASLRTLARIGRLNQTIARVMAGHLDERLPTFGRRDAVDRLSLGVNGMLDEIQRLLAEVQGVGDDIAHDLRTPLTRLRSRLERGRTHAPTREDLAAIVDKGIGDLDQCLGTITALLRIGQIENGRRRENFGPVSLGDIVREAADLYQPLAELRRITLVVEAGPVPMVTADRDLLFEAVANLLDNAVKFSPEGGTVRLAVEAVREAAPGTARMRVQDTGPGIPPPARVAMLRRFQRGDRSRHVEGHGLGLSIVSAILRLHGFALEMGDADGCFAIDVLCPGETVSSAGAPSAPYPRTDSSGS